MTRNANFDALIWRAMDLAEANGLEWDVTIGHGGEVPKSEAWDLCQLAGIPRTGKARLTKLGPEPLILRAMIGDRDIDEWPSFPLDWVDLLKAVAVEWVLVQKNVPGSLYDRRIRPLRVVATCAGDTPPWLITPGDARRALVLAGSISKGLREATETCIARVLDQNRLVNNGPLLEAALAGEDRIDLWNRPAASSARQGLSERRTPEKLPGVREFNELLRIVFTEKPKTFRDALYFSAAKIHICTGFRISENCLIPLDWRRERTYFTRNGQPASEVGGTTTLVGLRHFPRKQRGHGDDGTVLAESVQWIPPDFVPIIEEALDAIRRLTDPLRNTLRAQVESGRLFADFEPDQLVPVWEFYPRLSGDLRLIDDDLPPDLEREYRETFNPEILDRLWHSQCPPSGRLRRYAVNYFHQFGMRKAGKGGKMFPVRKRDGSTWDSKRDGPIHWLEAFVRAGELEEAVKTAMYDKLPDLNPYKLPNGGKLYPHELLMLSPNRPITETRNGNILDVNRYAAIGVLDPQEYRRAFSRDGNNIFTRYGQTDEDKALRFSETHTIRHLMNTELFRKQVADTIITKHFDRRSVQQSYVYDHRSLAEELDAIELPQTAMERLPPVTQKVLRLIESGRAVGPIITAFHRIRDAEGELAALDFLAAEAGGFHATPYGHCVTSFLTAGCPIHLECFNGCRRLVKTDDPDIDEELTQMEAQLERALTHAMKASPDTVGRQNQIVQIKRKLANVRRLLAAKPGETAFPDGEDLSESSGNKGRTILDDK